MDHLKRFVALQLDYPSQGFESSYLNLMFYKLFGKDENEQKEAANCP